jgi:hypothetical protein
LSAHERLRPSRLDSRSSIWTRWRG